MVFYLDGFTYLDYSMIKRPAGLEQHMAAGGQAPAHWWVSGCFGAVNRSGSVSVSLCATTAPMLIHFSTGS